ncbi:glutathione S-transferase [Xylaria sp. FL1042]|nr:glutathione S-transferase [Xylaria sp. FL1042]
MRSSNWMQIYKYHRKHSYLGFTIFINCVRFKPTKTANLKSINIDKQRDKMPQVTFYHVNGACSLVPHILLCQLGIDFKSVPMKFREGDDGLESVDGTISKAEYRKINPAGYVPVLVVDGELVTEQIAVLTMILFLSPDKEAAEAYLGRDTLGRVRVAEWMAWLSDTPHSHGYGAFLHPQRFVEGHTDMYSVVKAKGMKTIEYSYDIIEKRLADRTYVVGEHLTVVDFFVYVLWGWGARLAKIDMKSKYPAYGKLVERVEALPAVRKAVKEEEQPFNFS